MEGNWKTLDGAAAVGSVLKAMRTKAGLKQETLASKLGVTGPVGSYYEHGKTRIGLLNFLKWADTCGVDRREAFESVLYHLARSQSADGDKSLELWIEQQSELLAKKEADAALGALVRRIPDELGLHGGIYWTQNEGHERSWFYYYWCRQSSSFATKGGFTTPEEAIRAALEVRDG